MKDGLIISALSIIPKKPVARLMGRATRIQLPTFLHRLLIRYFVWKYKVNLEEAEGSIDDFQSLSEFFVRPLKAGRRPVDSTANAIVSPADGRVHRFGKIEDGLFVQSQSQHGSVQNLLGLDNTDTGFEASRYQNGSYIIIYLSPQDYHRVHIHKEGALSAIQYHPGKLWPVFPAAANNIKSLFDRNERLLFSIQHDHQYSVLAMIGAFGVGRMTTNHIDIITNTGTPRRTHSFSPPIRIQRGEETGRFELGSTVILFFEDEDLEWTVEQGQKLRLGEKIASKVMP